MKEFTHIDLFSGIGGFALAARWAGIKTVQFVEIDPFCRKVLQKNFKGVPIHDDIKTFKWTGERPFLITGGFPCQPFSCAGKRKGTGDDRHLWPEMLRVIKEFNPEWIIGENVGGIINIKNLVEPGGDFDMEDEADNGGEDSGSTSVLVSILSDLNQAGYSVQLFLIPACSVGSPHRRDRVWIVAHSEHNGGDRTETNREYNQAQHESTARTQLPQYEPAGEVSLSRTCGNACADHAPDTQHDKTSRHGQDGGRVLPFTEPIRPDNRNQWEQDWYSVALRTCVRGVDDGVSRGLHRTDRLKSLGNSVIPQIPYLIMKAILRAYHD